VYPVLYVLDADDHFALAVELAAGLARSREAAEIVVVGLAYPEASGACRLYELTGPAWDRASATFRLIEGGLSAQGLRFTIGGAPALVDFLTACLVPEIEGRYRVDSAGRGLFGHSAAGNFVARVLFSRSSAFGKYVAASPSFSTNDWEVFELEREHATEHDDLAAELYLTAGARETLDYAPHSIVSGTARLAEMLAERRYPSLRLACDLLPGKTHQTAVAETLERALVRLWPPEAQSTRR
jgi:predicted alpha/beta superfamily hydrolase